MPASHYSGGEMGGEGDEDLLHQLSQDLDLQQFANDASYQVRSSYLSRERGDTGLFITQVPKVL